MFVRPAPSVLERRDQPGEASPSALVARGGHRRPEPTEGNRADRALKWDRMGSGRSLLFSHEDITLVVGSYLKVCAVLSVQLDLLAAAAVF